MPLYLDPSDPMVSASYRTAVRAAERKMLVLSAERTPAGWIAIARHTLTERSVTAPGRTAADAAWHALNEFLRGEDR